MIRSAASERQVQAADPVQSTWLSANAGSGKTRVLIDRVARLLLGGTEPQRILCLTYTKAAASEMQNRLFDRLGKWAMLPEPKLRDALRELGIEGGIDAETLARARRLFARAIETPGGLKIQTIHSFCAALLRRFPLEAGISPDFTEMDDRAAKLMRDEIVEELAAGADVAAVDAISGIFSGEDLSGLLGTLCRMSDAFSEPLDRAGALGLFGLPAEFDAAAAIATAFDGSEAALISSVVPILRLQSKTVVDLANLLAGVDTVNRPVEAFDSLCSAFLYRQSGGGYRAEAKTGSVPTKNAQKALGPLLDAFHALMNRVADAFSLLQTLAAAEKTLALHRFATAFLPRYETRKAAHGWLDFDDLIVRSARLLSDPGVAAWVLFRLDGGIDHILVDEAQDTSPSQWTVVERLADDFTAGESARGAVRTVFVVGDKKQSIYSFQGADLVAFDRMQDHFATKYAEVGIGFQRLELEHSFRSSDAILRVVDLTFAERVNRGLGGYPKHVAFHTDLPGRVDIWPAIPKTENPEAENWYDPTDILPEEHETIVLARRIAAEIKRMIDAGACIATKDGPKPVDEGDFLILVQRRSDLFHEIIRACKSAGLDIAGADRLKIGGELAVKDLGALLRFLATPEDDLSLAAALRSPLFGWSEGALYNLAHGRGDAYLWAALRDKAAAHPETLAVLNDLRDQADFLRPYDLIERMLTRHGGRDRLIARLGPEAEDGIDALLGQALAFERSDVPSLTGFLVWMETDDVEIKRRLDSASKSIRVMTVHGAKGLEAPIVILPDTAKRRDDPKDEIYLLDGHPVWKTKANESPARIAALRTDLQDRQREERMRLLYVAMTRAEVWLIVCGAGDVGQGADSWYSLTAEAVEKAGAIDLSTGGGPGRRHECGTWPADMPRGLVTAGPGVILPGWAGVDAPAQAGSDQPLSPSGLGGEKALPGEEGLDEDSAKRRGTWLHLLLEHLPLWPEKDWPAIASSLLETGDEFVVPAETEAILNEARHVLRSSSMAALLVPGALSEVEVTAALDELGGRVVHGTIDRLLIDADRILAVDYKSNAVVPARAEEVPDGLLRQMGAYAAVLERIYPGRRVETAILWTKTGDLMPLPRDIVRDALSRTTIP
ncbi:double-strand break repair helicase AddA [Defluviimonas sp. SAOS-178_SWC]|uniref:double-strand break repair helicase AddA n=1 Tax=Defluviimonas sp. SAOS-178_SWC TaxID=3121287 RepID=UPI003222077E